MIRNISLTLIGGHAQRGWVDDKEVDNAKLLRVFRILKKADSLPQQKKLLSSIMRGNDYHTRAKENIIYHQEWDEVRISECIYASEKKKFTKGKYIGSYSL